MNNRVIDKKVQVHVNDGVLEGELIDNEYGDNYYSFKGIPYAEPPIGDLRFKAPRAPKPWKGIRAAKEFGPICYQVPLFTQEEPQGSEDCLYLNVYTPNISPETLLPVIFWIHGGGFKSGSGNDDVYGPEFLVKHNVILVTFNYRLEVLGFLCLDTKDIPGNAGMKDQVAALKWVNRNIINFGGDVNNITICGQSAGAACVTYHLVSPMSEGLFKRAIVQSGAATCPWAFTFEPRERALALARQLGFESEDDQKLYEFFKSIPIQKIIQIKAPITITEEAREGPNLYFAVVNEKKFEYEERFFYGDVFDKELNCKNKNVEIIIGYTENEGFFNLAAFKNDFTKVIHQVNNLRDFMVPDHIIKKCSMNKQLEIGRRFKKYYLGNDKLSLNNLHLLSQYYSFAKFVYGIMQWAKFCAKSKTVYLYKFTCKSERNFLVRRCGLSKIAGDRISAGHVDDLAYLFPTTRFCPKLDKNSESWEMVNNLTTLWTNFAKCGNPTPGNSLNVNWHPYTFKKQAYLIIGNDLKMSIEPNKEEIEFWENIFKEFLPDYVAEISE